MIPLDWTITGSLPVTDTMMQREESRHAGTKHLPYGGGGAAHTKAASGQIRRALAIDSDFPEGQSQDGFV
jgi:hypothetical protein